MGLPPPIAKLVPEIPRRFFEGLHYLHTFSFLLPAFIIGLLFWPFIPYPEQVLTAIGIALFFSSKVRRNCHALNTSDLPPLEKRRFAKRKTASYDRTVLLFRPAGLPASQGGESGQVRKEAATTTLCECRG